MTTDVSRAMDEARQAVEGDSAPRFVQLLADRMGAQAGVQAVFGQPIERGELTVVPVGRIRWVFGGGLGMGGDRTADGAFGSGSGGGGGVSADPVGYLEIGPNGSSFKAIVAPYPSPILILASGLTAAVIVRALARLIRG